MQIASMNAVVNDFFLTVRAVLSVGGAGQKPSLVYEYFRFVCVRPYKTRSTEPNAIDVAGCL